MLLYKVRFLVYFKKKINFNQKSFGIVKMVDISEIQKKKKKNVIFPEYNGNAYRAMV